MDRLEKLLYQIGRSARILEIGPSYNPAAPKAAGWKSFVLDHATQAELQAKYKPHGVATANIEPVDFVWRSGDMRDAVPKELHGAFDACIASHVIEHVPDPIAFFRSLDRLLASDGIISLAVPDKRFCFDFFRPLTVAPAWIEAFEHSATRHSRRNVLEFGAYHAYNGERFAWGQEKQEMQLRLMSELASAKAAADAAGQSDDAPYVDVHAWCFTPSSFELLIAELGALELIDFRVVKVFPASGCEFVVSLRRGREPAAATALQEKRLELLKAIVAELGEERDRMRMRPTRWTRLRRLFAVRRGKAN